MKPSKLLGAALALTVGVLTSQASAQTTEHRASMNGDNYTYHFTDDDLLGDTLNSPPPIVRGSFRSRRILLIRARATFVPELVESVATM